MALKLKDISEKLEKLSSTEIDFSGISRRLAKYTFRYSRINFYEDLSGMLNDRINVRRALEFLIDVETDFGKKTGSSGTYFVCCECLDALNRTGAISSALKKYIKEDEYQLISSGEIRGDLASGLIQAGKIVKSRSEMTMTLITSMIYPSVLLIGCLANMYMVYETIMPIFISVAPEERWTSSMRLLTDISGFFINNGLYLSVFCILVFFIIRYSLPRYTGPGRQYLDYIPPWSLYKIFNGVSYLFNMAAMLSIDIPVAKALERIEKNSARNRWLQERIKEIRRYVLLGQSLAMSMKNCGYDFPSEQCINKLLLHSDNSDNAQIMSEYADKWLEEAKGKVKKTGVIITILSVIMVFAFVVTMLSAIYSISDILQR
ncbi:type II secretion protein F [Salmonella enterica subsp. enterica serovar 4,[5],12:b:-]|nr:type II secretion protein F [Salmonella enterica subsp. enterica serovar 4,[5],12:b:-]